MFLKDLPDPFVTVLAGVRVAIGGNPSGASGRGLNCCARAPCANRGARGNCNLHFYVLSAKMQPHRDHPPGRAMSGRFRTSVRKTGQLFLRAHGDCFLHVTAGWLSYWPISQSTVST